MNLTKTTIFVVDDEVNIRELLVRILEKAGYGVLTAANGNEALEKLAQSNVSLVLLDIRMPELDGFETLKRIREKSEIPVMMLTGVDDAASIYNALGLGADDYVKKPFRREELLARIHSKLRRALA